MNERFHSLEDNIGRFLSEFSKLKEMVGSNLEEIKELKEDQGSISERYEELERKLEYNEQVMKACNIRVIHVEEDEWEVEHTTTQTIVNMLDDHSSSGGHRQSLPSWEAPASLEDRCGH
ncbi:hypothetical protein ACOMHN_000605 [Nucella lapillus]